MPLTHKLVTELERDIRNQVLIDQMKKLTLKGKLMILIYQNSRRAMIVISALAWIVAFLWAVNAWAADVPQCPDAGVKCKVIYLNAQEEQMLMTQNGILDTAAQGRALELGQFAVFLKTKIAAAPQGEVKQPPAPPAAPPKVDSGVPADVTPN